MSIETETAEPDAWHEDPSAPGRMRYWQSGHWSSWVHQNGTSSIVPLPEPRIGYSVTPMPARAALFGVAGAIVAAVASGLVSYVVEATIPRLLAGTTVFYGLLTLTAVLVTRKYGTGRIRNDLGLDFRWSDLGSGVGACLAARALAGAVIVTYVALRDLESEDVSPTQFETFTVSDTSVILVMAIALFMAPLFEEIFFRGFLQNSLMTRFGPIPSIAVISVLFGLVHMQGDFTAHENTVIFVATGIAGVVFGFVYWATKRLGTAIAAHFFFNLVAVTVMGFERWG